MNATPKLSLYEASPHQVMGNFAQTLLFDGSFEGLLSAVFTSYSFATECKVVKQESHIPTLFEHSQWVESDPAKSQRVWEGIQNKCGIEIANMVHLAFLSPKELIPTQINQYLRLLFAHPEQSKNILNPIVQSIFDTARQVRHEAHRFQGFVRFRQAKDGFLYAIIDPECDIIDILHPHFQRRYPNESWMIVDSQRGKGVRFEKGLLTPFFCDPAQLPQNDLASAQLAAEGEDVWVLLWKNYYNAVNISERKNTKLMLRCLPRKYWKYLPERQG